MTTQVHIRNVGTRPIMVQQIDPDTREPLAVQSQDVAPNGEHAVNVHSGAALFISEVQPEPTE